MDGRPAGYDLKERCLKNVKQSGVTEETEDFAYLCIVFEQKRFLRIFL